MTKEADGLWYVTTTPQVVGFHYYSLAIDGAVVADPATRTFFGSGWHNSAIEVPEPAADADYYSLKDVPRGTGAPAVVLLEGDGDVAPRLRLHAAGLRHQHEDEISGAVSAARLGRERARLARSGARRRHHGQPDRGEKGQAHDHRHGQPERGEAGRERSVVLRPGIADAGRPSAPAGARRRPRADARPVRAAAVEARWPAASSPR